jgi:hypothetical protein
VSICVMSNDAAAAAGICASDTDGVYILGCLPLSSSYLTFWHDCLIYIITALYITTC